MSSPEYRLQQAVEAYFASYDQPHVIVEQVMEVLLKVDMLAEIVTFVGHIEGARLKLFVYNPRIEFRGWDVVLSFEELPEVKGQIAAMREWALMSIHKELPFIEKVQVMEYLLENLPPLGGTALIVCADQHLI